MNDEQVKKAAELLIKGAKMLNFSCPQCNNPIFQQKDDRMICISCNQHVIREDEVEIEPLHQEKKISNSLVDPIQSKIDLLGEQLISEQDPHKILEIAELISKLKKLND
ncbi:MAG: hypothetical protein INQ03_07210 [Candidatus Heimdallarchaeota archaeon]|nr:hypothetical protein [Candidatus Heimdallarchaeota archaeon]